MCSNERWPLSSERKIGISQETINLLISRSSGDRNNLSNELLKIENFLFEKKTISLKELYLLTNLSENFNISELVDNCLAKNQNRIMSGQSLPTEAACLRFIHF